MSDLRFCILLLAASPLLAQQHYSAADIENGSRLYRANCFICHGPDGNYVTGVDLGHNKFRRASTDADLIHIILTGIPGTAMPPHKFSEYQAATVVAYLRSMAASAQSTAGSGDPTRGKALFDGKGGCTGCHRILGNGSRLGPDLSEIGSLRRAADLEISILDPNEEILPENRFVRVVTKDGAELTGRLLNEDMLSVQILDAKERLLSFSRSDLREFSFVDRSPMPSYRGKLSSQEVSDLVSYLISLKGVDKP